MITFEYMIEQDHWIRKDKKGYSIYTHLKARGHLVMVGTGEYSSLWSARRGISRIVKLLAEDVVVINVGEL